MKGESSSAHAGRSDHQATLKHSNHPPQASFCLKIHADTSTSTSGREDGCSCVQSKGDPQPSNDRKTAQRRGVPRDAETAAQIDRNRSCKAGACCRDEYKECICSCCAAVTNSRIAEQTGNWAVVSAPPKLMPAPGSANH